MLSDCSDGRFVLRRALNTDDHALAQLNRQAFLETYVDNFRIPISQDDIDAHFRNTMTAEVFSQKIADPQQAIWVVEDTTNHRLVAFLNAGPCFLPNSDVCPGADGEIDRIYVLRDGQGHGLGSRLIKEALSWLSSQYPARPIWLGVWSGNDRAQGVFRQHGFEIVGDRDFRAGTHPFYSFIMRRECSPQVVLQPTE